LSGLPANNNLYSAHKNLKHAMHIPLLALYMHKQHAILPMQLNYIDPDAQSRFIVFQSFGAGEWVWLQTMPTKVQKMLVAVDLH
jgi:hypothetical protein